MSSAYMTTVAGDLNQQHATTGGNFLQYTPIQGTFGGADISQSSSQITGGRRRGRKTKRRNKKRLGRRTRRRRLTGGACACNQMGGGRKRGGSEVNFNGTMKYQ